MPKQETGGTPEETPEVALTREQIEDRYKERMEKWEKIMKESFGDLQTFEDVNSWAQADDQHSGEGRGPNPGLADKVLAGKLWKKRAEIINEREGGHFKAVDGMRESIDKI